MKYAIRTSHDGISRLLRPKHPGWKGRVPTNAELEFWTAIQQRRPAQEELDSLRNIAVWARNLARDLPRGSNAWAELILDALTK